MAQQTAESQVTNRVWEELETDMSPGGRGRALKVLFATDGSDEAENARHLLSFLPLPAGSRIHTMTVMAGAEWTMPEWFVAGEHSWGESVSRKAAGALAREGVEVSATARSGAVAFEIIEAAEELDADLIVLGSKGLTGLKGFLLGSVARNVAKHAKRSVLVARELQNSLQRVLVAMDGSEHATAAARFAIGLPLPEETTIEVVSVLRPIQQYAVIAPEMLVEYDEAMRAAREQERTENEQLVREVAARLHQHGKRSEAHVLEGDPADQLLKHAAASGTDLLIVGARGISLIEGLLVGSVADRILRDAKCSVLLVR
jgi:nucleotide-binding universal stress UspA family protein